MKDYVILIAMLTGLPVIYWGILQWQRPFFEEEKTKTRRYLFSIEEIIVVGLSEIALIKKWYEYHCGELQGLYFVLLYTILTVMTVLCMTDYWERIVPNRILLILLAVCFIEVGYQLIKNNEVVIKMIPSMILGLIFCAAAFGITYIISHGNMGSGDVKLALLLGIFLTGKYVVSTIFYGCIISAVYSIVQLSRKKLKRSDTIPFVPFIYIGLIITYLVR